MPISPFTTERQNLLRLSFAALGEVMDACGFRKEFLAAQESEGIRADDLATGSNLTFAKYVQVLQALSVGASIPALGLQMGARKHPRSFGVFGIGMVTARDLGQGLRFVHLLIRLVWNQTAALALHQESGMAIARHKTSWPDGSPMARIAVEDLFLGAIRVISELLPKADWSACELRLRHAAPPHAQLYGDLVPCPCLFGQAVDELRFPAGWLQEPLPLANQTVTAYCEELCQELAKDKDMSLEVRQKVRACLGAMEASHYPTLQEMADMMRVSERSLRKGLAREAASFRNIVQSYKVELAQKYLAETRIPIKEIAFRLGFAQVPSFYRAFGRVDPRTPDQFRVEMAQGH